MAGCLFRLQRYSAIALVPFVVGHLLTILLVGSSGLTAGQVLGRTYGSLGWASFYFLFVLLIAVHGAIGLWRLGQLPGRLQGYFEARILAVIAIAFGLVTLGLGVRAILGLFGAAPPGYS